LAKTDEGEFELILGNKQLISVFLIVVVLLGVFFSMGYIVGRNSASPSAEAARTAKQAPQDSPPAETQAAPAPSSDSQEAAANPADNNVTPPAGTTETKPEQPAPKKPVPTETAQAPATKTKPSAVGPKAGTQPATKPAIQATVPPRAPAPMAKPTPSGEMAHGQYWQVVATSRPDAEIISEALNKKGFHTAITPASRQGFFRVLVGPFEDAATQAQARTKLEAAGFKNPINQRY
jgi:cell division septation protein DedD